MNGEHFRTQLLRLNYAMGSTVERIHGKSGFFLPCDTIKSWNLFQANRYCFFGLALVSKQGDTILFKHEPEGIYEIIPVRIYCLLFSSEPYFQHGSPYRNIQNLEAIFLWDTMTNLDPSIPIEHIMQSTSLTTAIRLELVP